MANLRELSIWEAGIYQLETSDPVMGGENGIDNRAPRQLANRTLWLKNELARQIELVNNAKLGKTDNAVSASKFATVRNIAMTGDGSWNVNFDGSQNATGAMTLANTGVTAGSYNSVTVDAKGRVTAGLTQTHGLVTATTTTGIANTVTTNNNTYLNIVASGVGRASSVGSSTQITGVNGVSVSSDTAGALTLSGTRATDTAVGVTMLSHNTNGTDKTKAASEFALGEVRRMANQAQVTADGIALTWNNVQNKPTTFPASAHRHNWNEIEGKPSTYPPSTHSHDWNSITGKPATFEPSTHTHQYISAVDDRTLRNVRVPASALALYFMHRNGIRSLPSATKDYGDFLVLNSYFDNSGGKTNALFFSKESNEIIHHQADYASGSAWEVGKTLAYKDDNVASASKLQTPRTINGVAFDGTQNITITDATKAPVAHRHNWSEIDGKPSTYPPAMHSHAWGEITGKPATFTPTEHTHNDKANLSGDNFTGKITAPYLELGALGNIPYPSISFNSNRTGSRYWSAEPSLQEFHVISRSGNGVQNGQIVYKFINRASGVYTVATTEDNVASATKLQTARTINGVAFDGTQNIVVSDSTKLGKTENAASASKLATPRNIALTGAVTGSVSFDGSQSVSISTQQTIQRVQKSMQIPTTHNFNNTPNVTVTGSVETFVDGRVVQYFTMNCSVYHFFRHNAAQLYRDAGFTVNYFGEGGAAFLELPLWTAMPNKVQRATINIAAVENNYIHEALEWVWNWESLWNTSKNIRDKCYFGFRRISGERDEKVQIHITVEGY